MADENRLILIVDDDPDVRETLQEIFGSNGYQCQVAADGREGLELFRASRPPLTVTDVKMPVMDGLEFLKAALALDPDAAIIMLTGAADTGTAIECLKHGACDFLIKPTGMEEMLIAAERALERRQLLIERREAKALLERRVEEATRQLTQLAQYDSLTGLPNRALFRDRLTQALARSDRSKRPVALMFIDLDRFKSINDTLGHDIGDQLLKAVASRLKECLREVDSAARLGGDEFTIILEGTSNSGDVARVAQRALDVMVAPFRVAEHEIFVTTSIGIAMYPRDGKDAESLIKNADTALYRAKEKGRNAYQFYTADMSVKALQRLSLENSLHRAVEREEFVLYYQPRMDLRTGGITGMEALVRWRHPERGVIAAAEFIPVAIESGLILAIGDWVLRQACAQTQAWQAAGLPPLRVTVNISGRQFRQKALVQTVARILKDTGLGPQYLELEVTEDFLMENIQISQTTLTELKAMGVRISIDDFGTGYSSLNYLKRFPIDTLKIDKSFVRDITTDPDAAAITAGVIALGRSLRLNVIAEGVETPEQMDFLRTHGCDEIQGYLFSRPLAAEAFAEWVREGGRLVGA